MMDCQKVKQLLPLWVGQDLPDPASTADVASHLEKCPDCERRRTGLQASLDVLQGSSAETLSDDPTHSSVWPTLVSRISEWDRGHGRERFNGWIPASVMALAVALMIAVSLPSIRDEFFSGGDHNSSTADLFELESRFDLDAKIKPEDPSANAVGPQRQAFGTPVIYKDPW